MRRAIQRRIVHPLSMKLLSGEVHPGATVIIDVEEGEWVSRQAGATPATEAAAPGQARASETLAQPTTAGGA
ncbi:MAG: hypothetical protein ACHQ4H_08285 [Ktedonobacterales bacterium]